MRGHVRGRWRYVAACPFLFAASVGLVRSEKPTTSGEAAVLKLDAEPDAGVNSHGIPPTLLEVDAQYPDTRSTTLEVETQYPQRPGTVLQIEATYPPPVDTLLAVEDVYPDSRTVRTGGAPAITRPALALTFDTESPHGLEARRTLARVLDELHDAGIRSTFFVVGWWARDNGDMLRRMVADGHEVANHSLTHQRFMHRTPGALSSELRDVADIVLRETGTPIAPFFRPPYGCIDEPAARLARQNGYQVVGWTAAGGDAQHATRTPQAVVAALLPHLQAGDVVLLHTNRWITAEALPYILRTIEARGLEVVRLSDLLRLGDLSPAHLGGTGLRDCTWRAARASRIARHTAD